MKPRISNQTNRALTLTEVLVVVFMLAVLAAIFFPNHENPGSERARRIACANNLKQICFAYKIWGGNQNDKYPMQVSITNGGTLEYVEKGDSFRHFQILSNELSTPKILICPADIDHSFATNFGTGFNNSHVSYFVGLDASTNFPGAFLCGDDNFAIGGVPVKSGLLEAPTNAPIAWTAARHHFAGNIGLCDGSVQEVSQDGLRQLFQQTGVATNRLAIP